MGSMEVESPEMLSNKSKTCSNGGKHSHNVQDADDSLSPFNVTNASSVDN